MPCFEPVMMMEVGDWEVRRRGRKVEMPFMTPWRFVSRIWGGLSAVLFYLFAVGNRTKARIWASREVCTVGPPPDINIRTF